MIIEEGSSLDDGEAAAAAAPGTWRRRFLSNFLRMNIGLLIVGLLVLNSNGQAELVRHISGEVEFHSYYLLTWLSNGLLVVVWPALMLLDYPAHVVGVLRRPSSSSSSSSSPDGVWEALSPARYLLRVRRELSRSPGFSWWRYGGFAALCAAFNVAGSYLWYLSLRMVPVAVNAVLYRTSLLWVTVFSVFFLGERVGPVKVAALGVCLAGVALLGVGNAIWDPHREGGHEHSHPPDDSLLGYPMVGISAVLFAGYEVAFRRGCGAATPHAVAAMNALIGVASLALLWPPLPVLAAFLPNVEKLPGAVARGGWEFVAINVAFAAVYYLLYTVGITITSPVYMSFTSVLSIPVAALVDRFLERVDFSAMAIVGMLVTVIGVVLIYLQHVFLPQDSFSLLFFRRNRPRFVAEMNFLKN